MNVDGAGWAARSAGEQLSLSVAGEMTEIWPGQTLWMCEMLTIRFAYRKCCSGIPTAILETFAASIR